MIRIDGDIEELRSQLERTWGLLFSLKSLIQTNADIMELGLVETISNAELRISKAITTSIKLIKTMSTATPLHQLLALDYEVKFLLDEFSSMTERNNHPENISSTEYRAFEFGLDGIFVLLYEAHSLSSNIISNSEIIPKVAA
jgi:hypothetical protein